MEGGTREGKPCVYGLAYFGAGHGLVGFSMAF